MQPFAFEPLFYLRPALLAPSLDSRFVAFLRLGGWLLAAPSELPQYFPHVRGMIANAEEPKDHLRDPRESPQFRDVAKGGGAAPKGAFELLQLPPCQARHTACSTGRLQAWFPALLPLPVPPTGTLTADAQLPGHFALRVSPSEKGRSLHPSFFKSTKIASHAGNPHQSETPSIIPKRGSSVTILCKAQ